MDCIRSNQKESPLTCIHCDRGSTCAETSLMVALVVVALLPLLQSLNTWVSYGFFAAASAIDSQGGETLGTARGPIARPSTGNS